MSLETFVSDNLLTHLGTSDSATVQYFIALGTLSPLSLPGFSLPLSLTLPLALPLPLASSHLLPHPFRPPSNTNSQRFTLHSRRPILRLYPPHSSTSQVILPLNFERSQVRQSRGSEEEGREGEGRDAKAEVLPRAG